MAWDAKEASQGVWGSKEVQWGSKPRAMGKPANQMKDVVLLFYWWEGVMPAVDPDLRSERLAKIKVVAGG